ncbi:hypothetical protein CSAL01_01286 [Colletotrichum salicis]|uniref:Uncharacterized protein n=1 Tax=Colletotrichum salicis TaxID=1209931 RepID=A0A135TYX2_9PEZI|nr:hypothetical protein CSAL01_01286 [Colletotrichum salicis]
MGKCRRAKREPDKKQEQLWGKSRSRSRSTRRTPEKMEGTTSSHTVTLNLSEPGKNRSVKTGKHSGFSMPGILHAFLCVAECSYGYVQPDGTSHPTLVLPLLNEYMPALLSTSAEYQPFPIPKLQSQVYNTTITTDCRPTTTEYGSIPPSLSQSYTKTENTIQPIPE